LRSERSEAIQPVVLESGAHAVRVSIACAGREHSKRPVCPRFPVGVVAVVPGVDRRKRGADALPISYGVVLIRERAVYAAERAGDRFRGEAVECVIAVGHGATAQLRHSGAIACRSQRVDIARHRGAFAFDASEVSRFSGSYWNVVATPFGISITRKIAHRVVVVERR